MTAPPERAAPPAGDRARPGRTGLLVGKLRRVPVAALTDWAAGVAAGGVS